MYLFILNNIICLPKYLRKGSANLIKVFNYLIFLRIKINFNLFYAISKTQHTYKLWKIFIWSFRRNNINTLLLAISCKKNNRLLFGSAVTFLSKRLQLFWHGFHHDWFNDTTILKILQQGKNKNGFHSGK